MKNLIIALVLITGFSSFAIKLDNINIGHHGKYVWRGINFNNRPVNQGDISFSYKNFGLNAWWNYDVSREDPASKTGNEFTEVDYTINYAVEVNGYSFEGGFIYYDFPNLSDETREFYISVSLPFLFNPTLSIYQDIHASEGLYYQLGVSEDFQIKFRDHEIPVNVSMNLGFNSEKNWGAYYTTDISNADGEIIGQRGNPNSGITNFDLTLTSSYDLSDSMTLQPYVSFSALLNGAQNGFVANAVNVWVGLNLAMEF